jgi:predicted Zn-dependent protease
MIVDNLNSEPPEAHSAFVAIAEAAAQRQQTLDALAAWAAVRDRFSNNPRAWARPGQLLLNLGRFDEADALLGEGVRRFPTDFWIARSLARVAEQQGDRVEALVRARTLRYAFPTMPVAWSDFAGCLLDAGSIRAADSEAEAGLVMFPAFEWLLSVRARCAEAAGDMALAADRWCELLAHHPSHRAAYSPAVRTLAASGRRTEALGIALAGLALFPDLRPLHQALAEPALAEQGAFEQAPIEQVPIEQALAERGLDEMEAPADTGMPLAETPLDDEAAAAMAARADDAERAGDWRAAERLWFRYRRDRPNSAAGYAGGARALLRLGRTAEAEIVLAHAMQVAPADPLMPVWSEAALQRQDLAEALRRFQVWRNDFPQAFAVDPAAAGGLADVLLRLGRVGEVENELAHMRGLVPTDLALATCYAEAASLRGDWTEAVRRWSDVWAGFPDHPTGHLRLAEAMQQVGNLADADAILADATERFPDDRTVAERWAEAAQANHDGEFSVVRWTAVCQRFPDHLPAWLARAERLQAIGRNAEAERVLSDVAARFPASQAVCQRHAAAASRRRDFTAAAQRSPSGGWTQPPMADSAPAGTPERVAVAVATSREAFAATLGLLRSLFNHCTPNSCPALFLSVEDERARAELDSLLAAEPGFDAATTRIIDRQTAAAAAIRTAMPDVPPRGMSLAAAQRHHAGNYQRLQLVAAAWEHGADLVAVLDHRVRMFRTADLTAALRDAAARREYRFRNGRAAGEQARLVQDASVRSVWPAVSPDHLLFRACGLRDNLRLYRRVEFNGFLAHMRQDRQPCWFGPRMDGLEDDVAFQVASRLMAGADDWVACLAWSLAAMQVPYRLVALDDVADLFGVAAEADLWLQVRSSGFDQRLLRAVAPPVVPPTMDAALLAMIDECLPPASCLMGPAETAWAAG